MYMKLNGDKVNFKNFSSSPRRWKCHGNFPSTSLLGAALILIKISHGFFSPFMICVLIGAKNSFRLTTLKLQMATASFSSSCPHICVILSVN